jgi:hypothetical protein
MFKYRYENSRKQNPLQRLLVGDILRVVVFHHLELKKDLSTSLSVAADQCIYACNKIGREPMLKRNIVTKIRRKTTSKKELGTYETL